MKASVANTHSVHRCWQSFLRGTTRPSVSALLIVAFVFFIILSSYLFLLTADVMGGPVHRYFMDGEFDSQTIVTYRALSMKDASSPLVVILGTSVIIRCVLDEQTLASSIALHTSNKPVVYNLSADGQNTWEMAALVDCIPQGLSGVLVVGMTPSLLTFDSERLGLSITKPKLGFVSPSLDQEARRAGITPPIRTGIYSYDNAHYFLAHRRNFVFNLVNGGKDYADPLTALWMTKVNNPEFWQTEIKLLFERDEPAFQSNYADNLAVIQRFVDRLRLKGSFSIILVESPVNPRWYDEPGGTQFFKDFRGILKEFTEQHDLHFLPVTDLAQLKSDDFVDYAGHIGTPEAQENCNAILAAAIAKELPI